MEEKWEIRKATVEDKEKIHKIHVAAFPTEGEARLVDALGESGHLSLSLVAEMEGGEIVGHVAFSPIEVDAEHASLVSGVGLGPIAVIPAYQKMGIGSRLVEAALKYYAEEDRSIRMIVVLGSPEYYHRFGFQTALEKGLTNRYGVVEEFMVLDLHPDSPTSLPTGLVTYCAEFDLVS